jgi:TonB family protein
MSPSLITLIAWLTTMSLAPLQEVGGRPPFPGQPVRTEAELRAILETKPSDLAPYLELAHLYHKAGRTEDAVQVLRRALPVHPQSGAVYGAMLVVYGGPDNLEHREQLTGIAEEWIQAEPTNQTPHVLLGKIHLARAIDAGAQPADALVHLDRARQAIDDAFRLNPGDPMSHQLRLSIAKLRLDKTDDPAERARLQQEITVWRQEFAQLAKTGGGSAPTQTAAVAPPASPLFAKAVRVGGNIKPPTKIKDVKPGYPPQALQAGVQGVVIFEVVIDEAGRVAEARVLRSIALLDQAAVDAVRQWEFTPTLLNGDPVPVIMTATVQFTLPQPQSAG